MKQAPEYQRRAVLEHMKNLCNSARWHRDQIKRIRKQLKLEAEFIGVKVDLRKFEIKDFHCLPKISQNNENSR